MNKKRKYLLIVVLIFIMYLGYTYYPALNIVTGYASKNMASGLFLANRDRLSMEKQDNGFLPVNFASYQVDTIEKSVTASLFGLMARKAIYVEGLGAVLVNDDYVKGRKFKVPNRIFSKKMLPYPYGELPQKDTIFGEVVKGYDVVKKLEAVETNMQDRPVKEQKIKRMLEIHLLVFPKTIFQINTVET